MIFRITVANLLIDKLTRTTASYIDNFLPMTRLTNKDWNLINDITDDLPLLINIRTYTHKIQPENMNIVV